MGIKVPLIEAPTESQLEVFKDKIEVGYTLHREVSENVDRLVVVLPRTGERAARIRRIRQKRTEREA